MNPGPPREDDVRLSPPPRVRTVRSTTPGGRPATAPLGPGGGPHRGAWIAAAILGPLALLAILVLVVLPGWLDSDGENRTEFAETDPADAPGSPVPADPRSPGVLRSPASRGDSGEAAEGVPEPGSAVGAARDRAASLRDDLESRRAFAWAPDAFAQARDAMDLGDERSGLDDVEGAERAYLDAAARFEAIRKESAKLLASALEQGRAALAAGDVTGAAEAFTRAGTIDPGNESAEAGLQRVEALDRALAYMDEGYSFEREGRLADAERAYRQALDADRSYGPAREALDRMRAEIERDAFARAMSDGFAALDSGDHEAAREAFRRAGAMRPAAPEVVEALLRVEQAVTRRTILEHREDAGKAEGREDWHAAVSAYDAILALDPNLEFAKEGKEHTADRADLSDRLDYHLANPSRLEADEVFEEAKALLARAEGVENPGPRHLDQMARLERLIEIAGTPVPVVLVSDAVTEVTVYRVGRLGSFERRELELRPGSYTVVGSRKGYRDLRITLVVRAGSPPPRLSVRCEDPI